MIDIEFLDDIISSKIFDDFVCKFLNCFAAEGSSFFLVLIDVELFDGCWRDIVKLVFGSVLYLDDFKFDFWKGFGDDCPECFFDKFANKS